MFGFGKKSVVGIDIGTASIKLVEFSKSSGYFKLETYGVAQLTYGSSVTEGKSPLSVTINTLRELMARASVKSKKIVASLPTSTVFVTVIDIPTSSGNEQRRAIEFEAKKIIPIPLEDVAVSWNVIPPADPKEKTDKQSILLTAVPNHVIANYLKVFQELKLDPIAIEVEATALARSLIGNDTSTVLIIDVGSKTATVNLIDRGYIYFSKNVNVGGEAITTSISQTLNVNLERAEQFKKSLGLSGILENKNIPRSIQPILNIIRTEVEQVLHLAQSRGRQVEKIILTGGGAKLTGLDKYLSTNFNLPVTVGNPWARVLVPDKIKPLITELGPALAVCVGLAMRQED